jgi:stearoyl-CoA desaturase (delta-9 desaturase)
LERPKTIDSKTVPDLMKNKLVMFQHHYYRSLMIGTNLIAFLFIGWLLNDFLGAFILATLLRLFLLHHFTWFINSLAHTWGEKPFSQEHTAVNNYVISLLTFGEGYHNYHHTFSNDYRNGVRWYQFDPTKWLLWAFSKVGLVYDLKKVDWLTIKKRMVIEHRSLLLEHIEESISSKKEELELLIQEISDRIVSNISALNQLMQRYSEFKKQAAAKELLQQIKLELKELKKNLHSDWRQWQELSSSILQSV